MTIEEVRYYCEALETIYDLKQITKNKTIDQVLAMIDQISQKTISSGEFWTAEKALKVLRRNVDSMKGGDLK